MKDLEYINELYVKNEIFDLYENARILFNDYYNGKDKYNEEDIKNIYDLILKIIDNINDIESEID